LTGGGGTAKVEEGGIRKINLIYLKNNFNQNKKKGYGVQGEMGFGN